MRLCWEELPPARTGTGQAGQEPRPTGDGPPAGPTPPHPTLSLLFTTGGGSEDEKAPNGAQQSQEKKCDLTHSRSQARL